MSLLTDVGIILTGASVCSSGVGSTGWLLCYREFQPSPPRPVRQVCIVPTGGFASEQRAPIERPTFQVRVKGSTGEGATLDTKVQAVINALRFYSGTPGDRIIVDIEMSGDRFYLGRDEQQQPIYSLNFNVIRSITS